MLEETSSPLKDQLRISVVFFEKIPSLLSRESDPGFTFWVCYQRKVQRSLQYGKSGII